MDHQFQTKRNEIRNLNTALSLLEDAALILDASKVDREHIRSRCDSDIKSDLLREAVYRHARGMGRMLHDFDDLAVAQPIRPDMHTNWFEYIVMGAERPDAVCKHVQTLIEDLRCTRLLLLPQEVDEGSSSYSDYSASDTETSTEDDDGQSEDDDVDC